MPTVFVAPDETARELRNYVRANPDIRKDEYETDGDPVSGACYVLAEAYFHADGGTEGDLDIYCLSWSDVDERYEGSHWFLRNDDQDEILDLSLPTPSDGDGIPWDVARRRAFITGYEPSNRCERVLQALDIDY